MNFPKQIKAFILGALLFPNIVFSPSAVAGTMAETNDNYSWRRQLAAIEVAVDSYRLVLREMENMLSQLTEEAQKEPLGVSERHELWRINMAQSYKGLMGAKSDDLPLLLKMIHQNLLEQVELATDWEEPTEFYAIVQGIVLDFKIAAQQIKLYEDFGHKSSGFHDAIIDEDEALERVEEAVRNVQRDLIAINRIGRQSVSDGDSDVEANKYQLLVRLNISLRNMLEAMAVAGESGVDIGFTPQMVSKEYSRKVELFTGRLKTIDQLVTKLWEPIPAYKLEMTAKCGEIGENGTDVKIGVGRLLTVDELKVEEEWQPQLLVERRQVILDGTSWKESTPWQKVERKPFTGSRVLNETIRGGLFYEYLFKVGNLAGNYSATDQLVVACPRAEVTAPVEVTAKAAINGPERDDFSQDRTFWAYRDMDVIDVAWPLAASEQLPRKEKNLLPNALDHYELYRSVSDEEFEKVATLPPGTAFYRDRVSLARLLRTKSVRYQVKAVDREGREALSPISNPVRGDWDVIFEAALGGYFEYTNLDLDLAVSKAIELYPDYIVKAAHDWLVGIGKDTYPEVLARYWSRAPESLKIKWYGDEQKVRFDGNSLCLLEGPEQYVARDEKRLITEIWLALQPDVISMEPARWWKSLGEGQRHNYLEKWWKGLNPAYQQFLISSQNRAENDELVPINPGEEAPWQGMSINDLSQAVVVSWYDSLDSIEQDFLRYFWEKIPADTKEATQAEWWADQTEAYRTSVCFPAYNGLTKDEQQEYLKNGYEYLSTTVQARFLPYVYFEAASWGEKVDVVHHVEDKSRASKRQWLYSFYRPIDLFFNFHADTVIVVVLLLLLLAVGARLYWKKRYSFKL